MTPSTLFSGLQFVPGVGYVQGGQAQSQGTNGLAGESDIAMISGLGRLGQDSLVPTATPQPSMLDKLKQVHPLVWLLLALIVVYFVVNQQKKE